MSDHSTQHIRPLRRAPVVRSALVTVVALGLSPALAAVSQPTATGLLTGTIVDWPRGSTGNLRLSTINSPDLANAPIDTMGHFSLQLPSPAAFSEKLANMAKLFTEKSNYAAPEYGCKGQGTAMPDTGHFNYFGLFASVGDQPLQALKLTTDPRFPRPIGTVTSDLLYLDVPTTLDGTITCRDGSDTYQGSFPSGWSLPKITVTAGITVAVLNKSLSPEPLPATIAWRLRDQYAGIGVGLKAAPSGAAGFTLDPVIPDRPAALAGVQAGDLLVEIDGQDITTLSLDAALTLLRGGPSGASAGSKVTLGVKRGTDPAILHFTLTRVLFK